jgi:hypothetical protein
VLAATALFVALLWPTLTTNYHGVPPDTARLITSLAMLISFSVCGVGIMLFHGLLVRPRSASAAPREETTAAAPGMALRRFLGLGIGAALAISIGALLRRFYTIGTFHYDGRQYLGPHVQKITPIRPDDEFYQSRRT